jgi:chromatin structure-remodeling complex subunit RSC9
MLLSLKSGIEAEMGWALDRLWRLATNDQFVLTAIPGLTDALFELPEWYAREGYKNNTDIPSIFSLAPEKEQKRRYAAEALLILHNAAFINDYNTPELSAHPRTIPFLFSAIHNIDPTASDVDAEFVLMSVELLQAVTANVNLASLSKAYPEPLLPIENLLEVSTDRTDILAALDALGLILSTPRNISFLRSNSPAVTAAIRYLPLIDVDAPLVESCLNFFYVHLSHPPMAKAFLFHPDLPAVVRVLVNVLLAQQNEEIVTKEIGPPARTMPAITPSSQNHVLTPEEFSHVLPLPEPQRCYEWYATPPLIMYSAN